MSDLNAEYDPTEMINDAVDQINAANADTTTPIPGSQYQHVQAQSALLAVLATEIHAIRLLLEKDRS
ncbi:hypothetical protein [Herbiconiux sp.]|uniref:hypothetical protein n=1 Tax=Herbiconiux sp. TaxID=1871186 RepID=UPI0025BA2639|nr:hypothetical protein [Herbiconiux sp.]